MQEFLYQDSSFDLTNSEKYNLSIQASLDGFSVLLQNSESQSINFINYLPFKLSGEPGLLRKLGEILKEKDVLNRTFKKTSIILESNQIKIVPDQLVNEKNMKLLFNQKPKDLKGRSFITEQLTESYQSVFGINKEIIDFFENNLPDCKFSHETTGLIKFKLKEECQNTIRFCCLFHTDYYILFATKDGEILFFNTYPYISSNDILYYLFSALKLFKDDNIILELAGNISDQRDVYFAINKYFAQVLLWEPDNIKFDIGSLNGFSPHKIAPLLASIQL